MVPADPEVTMEKDVPEKELPKLYLGGLEWDLEAEPDDVKKGLENAIKNGTSFPVPLRDNQELIVNGARLEYFLVWDLSRSGEYSRRGVPPVRLPSSRPK